MLKSWKAITQWFLFIMASKGGRGTSSELDIEHCSIKISFNILHKAILHVLWHPPPNGSSVEEEHTTFSTMAQASS